MNCAVADGPNCTVLNFASRETVLEAMERILRDYAEVFKALAPHDTLDPSRPGWYICGCCRPPE